MKATTIAVCCLLIPGCSTLSAKHLNGVYQTNLTIMVKDYCLTPPKPGGGRTAVGGYFQKIGERTSIICLSTKNFVNIDMLWEHETKHLFRHMMGFEPLRGGKHGWNIGITK